jgi:hypothetical protein
MFTRQPRTEAIRVGSGVLSEICHRNRHYKTRELAPEGAAQDRSFHEIE